MKRAIWIGVLAVLAFAFILIVRLPASWLAGALPSDIACGQITGTVWNGGCSTLSVRKAAVGNLKWRLHPLPLLTGKVASGVEIAGPAGTVTAEIEARSGNRLTARELRASLELDPALLPQAPPNIRGTFQTDLGLLRVENGIVTGIEGRIEVRDLERRGDRNSVLGDYVVSFAPVSADGEPVGDVRSVKGPVELEGRLRLTREPGFVLDGLVKPRAGAPPEWIQELNALGTPDARGWRPFSVAGTF